MHCGHCQPFHEYHIKDQVTKVVDNFTDLGVRRSAYAPYSGHCEALATKACKVAGTIHRAFRSNSRSLLWPAFEVYVLPILMYLSPARSPKLKRDIDSLEKVQQRYTKLICNLRNLPYKERLRELNALSLSNRINIYRHDFYLQMPTR